MGAENDPRLVSNKVLKSGQGHSDAEIITSFEILDQADVAKLESEPALDIPVVNATSPDLATRTLSIADDI